MSRKIRQDCATYSKMHTNVDRANTFISAMKLFTKALGASFVSNKFTINSESGNLHFSPAFDVAGFTRKKKRAYCLTPSSCREFLTEDIEGVITVIPFSEKEFFLAFCTKSRIATAKIEAIKNLANVFFEGKGDILMPVSRDMLSKMLATCRTLAKGAHNSHVEVYELSSYIYNLTTISSFLSNEAERKWDVISVKDIHHIVQHTFKSNSGKKSHNSAKIACDKVKLQSMLMNIMDICGGDSEYIIETTIDDTRSMAKAPILNSMHFAADPRHPAMLTISIDTNKKITRITPLQQLQLRCVRSTVKFLEGIIDVTTKQYFSATISLPVWYVIAAKTSSKSRVIAVIDANDTRAARTRKVCESLNLKYSRVSADKAKTFFNKKHANCIGAVILKTKHNSQIEKLHSFAPSIPFIVISDGAVPRKCMRVSEKHYDAGIKKKLLELLEINNRFEGEKNFASFFADKENEFTDSHVSNFESAGELCAYVLQSKKDYIIITDDVKRFTDVGLSAVLHTKKCPYVFV